MKFNTLYRALRFCVLALISAVLAIATLGGVAALIAILALAADQASADVFITLTGATLALGWLAGLAARAARNGPGPGPEHFIA